MHTCGLELYAFCAPIRERACEEKEVAQPRYISSFKALFIKVYLREHFLTEAKLMRPFREFINRTSHEHGELIPNSTVDLQDGTKARLGTQFVFVPYEGSENSLVESQGRTDKDKLVFKAEGPLATEVWNNYRGCDWSNCELIYLKEGEAKALGRVSQKAFEMAVSGNQPAMTMFYLKNNVEPYPL